MSTCPTDEKLTTYINEKLPQHVTKNYKCISNSMIFNSKNASYMAYFAVSQKQELLLILINLSKDEERNTVRIVPVEVENLHLLQNKVLDFVSCPYMPEAFAVLAFDPRQKMANSEKLAFITSIQLDEIAVKLPTIKLIHIATKYIGSIKDIKWYPFAALTLLVLTESRLLVFKLDKNPYEPAFQLSLKDLKVANQSEVTKSHQFQKISFALNLNQEKTYQSLGKKLSVYLISNTGSIYMVFPFVPHQVILNEIERKAFEEIRRLPNPSQRKQTRSIKMLQILKDSKVSELQDEDQKEKRGVRQWSLNTSNPLVSKIEIFKLNSISYNRSSSSGSQNSCQKVHVFQVLTLNRHTLFFTGMRTKNKSEEFKVQIFSQEPYEKLMESGNYAKTENFNLQTVGQIRLDLSDDSFLYGNALQMWCPPTFDNNQIYFSHNNTTCYRVSLFELQKLLRNQDQEIDSGRLVDVDVLFDSKTKILTLCCNDLSIYVLRHANEGYLFQSIPLKSLQLKQKINKTIKETEDLFKQMAQQRLPENKQPNSSSKIQLNGIKESTISEIEKKLMTFSSDYKKSVQSKLQRIKKLYESIQSKNALLERQQNQKQQIMKLINCAQENDTKIKQVISTNKKSTNKTEEDISRRINATNKVIGEIRKRLETEKQTLENDEMKREVMEECEGQADAVINKLDDIKQQLLNKKNQLKRELGLF